MEPQYKKRSAFSGKIGFVLSAAGASVGLGNIWRFPYLAAKYGGGIFLLIYILLALTFGYTMIVAETALGRMTEQEPGGRFRGLRQNRAGCSFGGWINAIIPILIVPYYSVIGGWVIRYLADYIARARQRAGRGRLFLRVHLQRRFGGDLLCHLHRLHAGDHLCGRAQRRGAGLQSHDAGAGGAFRHHRGVLRHPARGAGGREIFPRAEPRPFLVDDGRDGHGADVLFAVHRHGHSDHVRLVYEKGRLHRGARRENVEIFDTAIAIMAGLMIIPAVFSFSGGDPDTLQAGPALMFITIPKVFESMGLGTVVGILFFTLVLFRRCHQLHRPDRKRRLHL